MSQTIIATFEDGVFKPQQPLSMPQNEQVLLTIEPLKRTPEEAKKILEAFEELWRTSTVDSQGDRMTRDELHERR